MLITFSILRAILRTYPGVSLRRHPWLAWDPQFVDPGGQRRLPSSGTPAAASQPTGPEPPWLRCGVPSVDIHQLHKGGSSTNRSGSSSRRKSKKFNDLAAKVNLKLVSQKIDLSMSFGNPGIFLHFKLFINYSNAPGLGKCGGKNSVAKFLQGPLPR